MEEKKKSAVVDLDDLDKKIKEQQQRLVEQEQQKQAEAPPLEQELPWTAKMQTVFKENIMKSLKCHACNWQNHGQKIIMMQRMSIMRESLPVISVICKNCGTQFVPKWCRKVINQAIETENRIMKERQLRRGVEPDGEDEAV